MQFDIVVKCHDCEREMSIEDYHYDGLKLIIEVSNACDCPDSPIATVVIPQMVAESAVEQS